MSRSSAASKVAAEIEEVILDAHGPRKGAFPDPLQTGLEQRPGLHGLGTRSGEGPRRGTPRQFGQLRLGCVDQCTSELAEVSGKRLDGLSLQRSIADACLIPGTIRRMYQPSSKSDAPPARCIGSTLTPESSSPVLGTSFNAKRARASGVEFVSGSPAIHWNGTLSSSAANTLGRNRCTSALRSGSPERFATDRDQVVEVADNLLEGRLRATGDRGADHDVLLPGVPVHGRREDRQQDVEGCRSHPVREAIDARRNGVGQLKGYCADIIGPRTWQSECGDARKHGPPWLEPLRSLCSLKRSQATKSW